MGILILQVEIFNFSVTVVYLYIFQLCCKQNIPKLTLMTIEYSYYKQITQYSQYQTLPDGFLLLLIQLQILISPKSSSIFRQ